MNRATWGRHAQTLMAATLVTLGARAWLLVPATRLWHQRATQLGQVAVTSGDIVTDAVGTTHSLVGGDSVAFLFLADAGCAACRAHARDYVAFLQWARDEGITGRVLLPNGRAAVEQYARLAGNREAVAGVEPMLFRRLGVIAVPTTLLIDNRGVVRARWLGDTPTPLAALTAVRSIGLPAVK